MPDATTDRIAAEAYVIDEETDTALRNGLSEFLGTLQVRRGGIRAAAKAMEKHISPRVLIVDVSGVSDPVRGDQRLGQSQGPNRGQGRLVTKIGQRVGRRAILQDRFLAPRPQAVQTGPVGMAGQECHIIHKRPLPFAQPRPDDQIAGNRPSLGRELHCGFPIPVRHGINGAGKRTILGPQRRRGKAKQQRQSQCKLAHRGDHLHHAAQGND